MSFYSLLANNRDENGSVGRIHLMGWTDHNLPQTPITCPYAACGYILLLVTVPSAGLGAYKSYVFSLFSPFTSCEREELQGQGQLERNAEVAQCGPSS